VDRSIDRDGLTARQPVAGAAQVADVLGDLGGADRGQRALDGARVKMHANALAEASRAVTEAAQRLLESLAGDGVVDDVVEAKLMHAMAVLYPEVHMVRKIIVDATLSAGDKMRALCRLDQRYLGYSSSDWAELFWPMTAGGVRSSAFWKGDRKKAIEAAQAVERAPRSTTRGGRRCLPGPGNDHRQFGD
jgi:hypothetical protein